MNAKPQLQRMTIAHPTRQSAELLTLPDELLVLIVRCCGLHGTALLVTTCKAAALFVDEQLRADLFQRALAAR